MKICMQRVNTTFLISQLLTVFMLLSCNPIASKKGFEGRISGVYGNTIGSMVVFTGSGNTGVTQLKAGQKFRVFSGTEKLGEIEITHITPPLAHARILSGRAAKEADVREIPAGKDGVKKEEKKTYENYTDNGDGTVTDTKTGLIWQRCSAGQNNDEACSGEAKLFTWDDALKACSSLQLAGKKWRLPAMEELKSLIYCSDGTKTEDIKDIGDGHPNRCGWSGGDRYGKEYLQPTINIKAFPETVATAYWSSSSYVPYTPNAWLVSFNDGSVPDTNKPVLYYVRCVSTGP
jgi:uncharacterized protein (TIGR02145 family)